MMNDYSNKSVDIISLSIMMLAPSIRLLLPSLNPLVLYVLLPGLFVWSIVKYKNNIKGVKYYFAFIIWLMITVVTSQDMTVSISCMKTIAGGLLSSVVMYLMASSKWKNGIYIAISYIFLFLTTMWYLWSLGELMIIDTQKERLSDELVNANDLAYYLFYVACSLVLVFYFFKVKRLWRCVIFCFLILVAIFISLITASRQIIVVVIPYIVLCMFFQMLHEDFRIKLKNIILPLILGGVLALGWIFFFNGLFANSYLTTRMETSVQEDVRATLLKEAIQVGKSHPVFGVGPGNMIKYSESGGFAHNSYAELFATSGIISVFLFLLMTVPFVVVNRKRFKKTKKTIFLFFHLTGIVWLLYNMLYVFYSSLWLISFYYLLMGISDNLYYQIIQIKEIQER